MNIAKYVQIHSQKHKRIFISPYYDRNGCINTKVHIRFYIFIHKWQAALNETLSGYTNKHRREK